MPRRLVRLGILIYPNLRHLRETPAPLEMYRGHLANSIVSSSNGGATAYAFGVKPQDDDYGVDPDTPFLSLSGPSLKKP